jgi:hypothetical protein
VNRLVCIVEGYGEVQAVPNLCARVLGYLGRTKWIVDQEPIRRPRPELVDESFPSPGRPSLKRGIEKAVVLAQARNAHAALFLCDSDNDCPGFWTGDVHRTVDGIRSAAVMAVREFESWILSARPPADLRRAGVDAPERVRDAKGTLRRLEPGYKPTTHQLRLTRSIDIASLRSRSRSFNKFVRSLESLCR